MKNQYKRTHSIGQVELWRHPEGHRFIRFKDSQMQGHETPHPSQIPKKDYTGINFVTSLKTTVNGKTQRVWAKEAGSEDDYAFLKQWFKQRHQPYNRHIHHARALRQLRAAGYNSPEALGILHPKEGKVLLLTTHKKGKPNESEDRRERVEENLVEDGFWPSDLHSNNLFKTFFGQPVIIDASRFGPPNKIKLTAAIKREEKRKTKLVPARGFVGRILSLLGLK